MRRSGGGKVPAEGIQGNAAGGGGGEESGPQLSVPDQLMLVQLGMLAPMINLLYCAANNGEGALDFASGTIYSQAMRMFTGDPRAFFDNILAPLQPMAQGNLRRQLFPHMAGSDTEPEPEYEPQPQPAPAPAQNGTASVGEPISAAGLDSGHCVIPD